MDQSPRQLKCNDIFCNDETAPCIRKTGTFVITERMNHTFHLDKGLDKNLPLTGQDPDSKLCSVVDEQQPHSPTPTLAESHKPN